ncbi:hypothetical protein [Niastella sp. OAS944]|uniref:hypothetical protein n=1 Tax=Niastella sp. OAS944 TaxID=2664089 RepID=UPI003493B71E|nr:hypothetical protein [Chitinophagaceae bacterium OAS944]
MNDHNLNKRFFTEADSPVPLIPADFAWDEMQKKLDPQEKKRRFIIWIPPVGCLLFAALLISAVAIIWFGQQRETVTTKHTTHTVAVDKPHPVKNSKDIYTPIPILTAQNTNKRNAYATKTHTKLRQPVRENAMSGDNDERCLPFAFPEGVALTDSISVQAYIPLPLFNKSPKEDSVAKAVWVQAGLHWSIPVPVEGNDQYLLGPNGKDQPYQYLLPGIWLSVNKNKQRITVSANPFISAPLPNKYYGNGMAPLNDSMNVYAQKRMVKMFGYQASLQYGYQFAPHWWLNGGISANWWKKGLVYATSADTVTTYKTFLYSVNTKDENVVTGFQLSANAAVSYQFKAIEAMLQVNTPFKQTIQNVRTPPEIRVGVRWRLLNKQVQPSHAAPH